MSKQIQFTVTIGHAEARFSMDDLDGRDFTVVLALQSGFTFYEIPLPTVLMALVQEMSGLFLDVGANTGPYSLLAAAANPNVEVCAFEPVPSVRNILERNIALNAAVAGRIQVYPQALSHSNGTAHINEHINFDLVPTGSTLETGVFDSSVVKQVDIETITLDSWVAAEAAKRRRPVSVGFLKVDVEGHEKYVMEGAEQTFATCRPMLIIELLSGADFDFFAKFLARHNYIDIALSPGEARKTSNLRYISDSWNHLFCPLERAWQFAVTCQRIGLPLSVE